MSSLREVLQKHLKQHKLNARLLAERLGVSYPTALNLVNKGTVPRSESNREALQKELGLSGEVWATLLAASQRHAVAIPAEGPLNLQQLLLKQMLTLGLTERTLAAKADLPYPTVTGITRKGAVPRGDALSRLAKELGIDPAVLELAAGRSKANRSIRGSAPEMVDTEAEPSEGPTLAQLALDVITRSGLSVAAFAREHQIPYLSLTRLISDGVPPSRQTALAPLAAALGLSDQEFAVALNRSSEAPVPADRHKASEIAANPFQAAIRKLMEEKGLSTVGLAELAGLSPITAARLVKKGELPGRQVTHQKLRSLLGLNESDYDLLLARSRQTGDGSTHSAQPAHSAPSAPVTALTPNPPPAPPQQVQHVPHVQKVSQEVVLQVASAASAGHEDGSEMLALISRLNPGQRRALHQFLLAFA